MNINALAQFSFLKLCMNPPISSLYSVGVGVRKEITALYLFFLQANISICLFFSFKFWGKYVSIQDSRTPHFRIYSFSSFTKVLFFFCSKESILFSSLSKVLCLCSSRTTFFWQIHSFVCPPTDLSCQHFICFPQAQYFFLRFPRHMYNAQIYIFLVYGSLDQLN